MTMNGTYTVTSWKTYTHPTRDPAFCADVHLRSESGAELVMQGIPGSQDAEMKTRFEGKKFRLSEVVPAAPKKKKAK